jgi:hypothetical protein
LRQLAVLVARYLDTITRDRRNLALLLLQAPAIAFLMKLGFNDQAFDTTPAPAGSCYPPIGSGQAAIMILFFLTLVPIWLGIFDATREIVKERTIYRRERMATIDVWPYLFSKVAVLAVIVAFQVATLLIVAVLSIDLPLDDLSGYLGLYVTLFLGGLLGMGMGLLVSSLVNRPDKANTFTVFLIIPQMLLAGAFISLGEMDPVTRFLSTFAAARWSFEALGAQVGILDVLQQQAGVSLAIYEGFLETFQVDVVTHLAVMAAGVFLLLLACYLSLRATDPL